MPRDPFEPVEDGLVAEALAIGGQLVDGILDALAERQLYGLYESVLALGRDDLERACLALAYRLVLGDDRITAKAHDPAEDGEPSAGARILMDVLRLGLRGPSAMAEEIRSRPTRELRWALLQPLESMFAAALERWREEEGW